MVTAWKPLAIASLALLLTATGGAVAVAVESTAAQAESGAVVPAEPATAPPVTTEPVTADPAACLVSPEPAPAAEPVDAIAGEVAVRFVIPPLTLVQVDGLGQPLAVSTNTGQAPCATDVFVAMGPDGARAVATDELRRAVLDAHLTGSWQAGVAEPFAA